MGKFIAGKGNCYSCKYCAKLTKEIWFCMKARTIVMATIVCNMGDFTCDFWRADHEILHGDLSEEN